MFVFRALHNILAPCRTPLALFNRRRGKLPDERMYVASSKQSRNKNTQLRLHFSPSEMLVVNGAFEADFFSGENARSILVLILRLSYFSAVANISCHPLSILCSAQQFF